MEAEVQMTVVLFDGDGVLIEPRRFARYLEREHNLTGEVTRAFYGGVYGKCVVGQADLKEVLPPFLSEWGWKHTLDDFLQRWFEEDSVVDQRLIAYIQTLRSRGIRCSLATNQEYYRGEYMRKQMRFGDLFDDLFFSAAIGFKKPEQGFYAHVTQALKSTGEKILFWDDEQVNVEGARAYGWRSERYVRFEEFLSRLTEYLPESGDVYPFG